MNYINFYPYIFIQFLRVCSSIFIHVMLKIVINYIKNYNFCNLRIKTYDLDLFLALYQKNINIL